MKKNIIPKDKNILKISIEEAMPDNYLPYAVEVAKDRALPDVRDGLKPVHRRIIYGAYMLKAFPDSPYYKSARIVGDILGKYHPHGDASVYDAMVILAQSFSTRETLIDGHGNFGSIDGDNAAAMRYTESRLTPLALEMLRDINKGVVNMVDNYSNSEKEPEVLPARYPNLLVNGTFGIAVGLATNIPPHNLGEVINGCVQFIDNPEISTKELMQYIKGPDLPTGGIIIGKEALLSAYSTGEGKVTLRAKTNIETLENGRNAIVITEFPYRKNKAKLLQTISAMTGDKKYSKMLESITDIRDESDRNGIRAVIEFRKSADKNTVEKVLKYLFTKTDLQSNLSFNMIAIANGKPETLTLKNILKYYVEHQKDVVTRRTKKDLEIAKKRFHIVEGFIKAIGIMDQIIETIRSSKSKKDAAKNIIDKYEFTEVQAESILELMLYRLTGLEIESFEKEHKALEKEIKTLTKILGSEKELLNIIKNELMEISEKFSNPRRTAIIKDDSEAKIHLEEILVDEDVVITQSSQGYIKRLPKKSYNRLNANIEDIDYRDGDYNKFLYESNTKDTILFFTKKGFMYQIKCINIPEKKWKERGEKLEDIIGIDLNDDEILSTISINSFLNKNILFITAYGGIKETSLDKFNTTYTKIMSSRLKDNDYLIYVGLKDKESSYLDIETKYLKFNFYEGTIDETDRNILPQFIIPLLPGDIINNAALAQKAEYEEFYINKTEDNLYKSNSFIETETFSLKTNSEDYIFAVTNKGNISSIPAYMLYNCKGINLNKILDEKVISLFSLNSSDLENKYIYFFSRNGYMKKTKALEFKDSIYSLGYKFKGKDLIEGDYIISSDIGELEKCDILLISENGMALKFDENTFTPVSRNASGIAAMNLKNDYVILGCILYKDENLTLKINNKLFNTSEIAYRNKGTKGVEIYNKKITKIIQIKK